MCSLLQFKFAVTKVEITTREKLGRKTATEQLVNVDLVNLSVWLRVVVFSDVHLDRSQEIPIRVVVTENALVSVDLSANLDVLGIVADQTPFFFYPTNVN